MIHRRQYCWNSCCMKCARTANSSDMPCKYIPPTSLTCDVVLVIDVLGFHVAWYTAVQWHSAVSCSNFKNIYTVPCHPCGRHAAKKFKGHEGQLLPKLPSCTNKLIWHFCWLHLRLMFPQNVTGDTKKFRSQHCFVPYSQNGGAARHCNTQ